MLNKKPVIGITMGDPSSIGPEIVIKALADKEVWSICNPLVVGDIKVFQKTINNLGYEFQINRLDEIDNAEFAPGTMDVFDINITEMNKLELGKVSAMSGEAAFQSVRKTIELALNGQVDATVTAPIHKESINLAGHKFSGHTEIYAHYTNTKKYAMLLVEENFRVIHVSTHVSLRDACNAVKKDRIMEVSELMNEACISFGISNPRIAIAGLNPHAGDGGLFGREEIEEIIPAIEELRSNGLDVEGPFPADTLFAIASGGAFDGCVAMYHDQGHIPFKMIGFQWDKENNRMKSVRGVNITLGLPIIRTSVDHGTAFEIAGKGIASPDAMILAIKYAVNMVNS